MRAAPPAAAIRGRAGRLGVRLPALSALLLVVACDAGETAPGPGGVTVSEAEALDEAAEMLEQRRLPAEAVDEAAGNQAPAEPAGKPR